MEKTFETDLRCDACIAAVRPILDADTHIQSWKVLDSGSGKALRASGDGITLERIDILLRSVGYHALREITPVRSLSESRPAFESARSAYRYLPLFSVFLGITLATALAEVLSSGFSPMRTMNNFMAFFFLTFAFFKLFDVRAFADAFQTYDLVAKRSRTYALVYPFLEAALGLLFLFRLCPLAANVLAFLLMGVGAVGVLNSLLQKQTIRCACLGTFFNLPMSALTLTEDLLMAGMSAYMMIGLV